MTLRPYFSLGCRLARRLQQRLKSHPWTPTSPHHSLTCKPTTALLTWRCTATQDEVIAVSEKVIVKLEDLVKWTIADVSMWTCGLRAAPLKPTVLRELRRNEQGDALHRYRESTLNSGLNFKDVLKEKAELGNQLLHSCHWDPSVMFVHYITSWM